MANNHLNPEYQERVLPSLSSYAALTVLPVSLFLVFLPFGEDTSLAIFSISSLAIIVSSYFISPKIVLTQESLRVGSASISRIHLGKAETISGANAFQARGSNLSPLAYTRFQSGIKTLVRVEIKDENDPTPYWLFSTRNPEILVQLINK